MTVQILKRLLFVCSFFIILWPSLIFGQKSVSGYVVDSLSKEPIVAATLKSRLQGTQTNEYGYFSVFVKEIDTLTISSLGFETFILPISDSIKQEQHLMLLLLESEITLDGITVSAGVESNSGGQIYLRASEIKKLPSLLGEKDPIKALLLLPGVQAGLEGTNSFFVRGGNSGENLLLLDEATVYNANHLFGFFSVFNIDAIKGLSFYKGNFPAQYGGRIASVIDIHTKEGDMKQWHGEGGFSFISSRLTLEGPIIKDKLSMTVSGRRTYADGIMALFQAGSSDKYYYKFYDLNGKIKWRIAPSTTLFISSYFGKDDLRNKYSKDIFVDELPGVLKEDSYLRWGNKTYTARLNHIFGKKIFSNTSIIYSTYFSENTSDSKTQIGSNINQELRSYDSHILEQTIKTNLNWSPSTKSNVNFGAWLSNYIFKPKIERLISSEDKLGQINELVNHGFNMGGFTEVNQELSSKTTMRVGLRAHNLSVLNKNYFMAEPRFNLNYAFNARQRISLDYSRMNQFINQIQSTNLGLSTDLWFMATDKVSPQKSDIYSLSFKQKIKNDIEFSVETYFRRMKQVVYLAKNQNIFLNEEINVKEEISDYVVQGEGIAGGLEFLLEKKVGKLSGLSSLTISRVIYKVIGLERDKPFLPFQDRPINFNIVGNYQLQKNIKLSGSWVYNTAPLFKTPIAYTNSVLYPNSKDQFEEPYMVLNNTNTSRGKDYHRLDLTIGFKKKKERMERIIEIGVYNVYFRKNPIFYSIQSTVDKKTGYSKFELKEVSLLPIIPFISYNIKF